MSNTIRKRNMKKGNIRKRRMRSYTRYPAEGKYEIPSFNQNINGYYPVKKTRNKKDIVNAANRSKKKSVRRKAKENIKKELEEATK